ncbi:MAG: PilN domain-containing protein [Sedimentisphaerales bacterium]|jgi:Tfp pilus assembly protein PilN
MVNVNFVPDDYAQGNECRRTNFMYIVLLAVMMVALGGSYAAIMIRQRTCVASEKDVNQKLAQKQEAIEQFEELQTKRREMMKTALTTAELIEPVPRSIVLASLTNNLPEGVSLSHLSVIQKAPKPGSRAAARTSKYDAQKAKQGSDAQDDGSTNPEKLLETHIKIGGIAPSDLQVAAYMERLGRSPLMDAVALVESKESKLERGTFRQFKLTAMLKKDVHLTKDDVEQIRQKAENSLGHF